MAQNVLKFPNSLLVVLKISLVLGYPGLHFLYKNVYTHVKMAYTTATHGNCGQQYTKYHTINTVNNADVSILQNSKSKRISQKEPQEIKRYIIGNKMLNKPLGIS